MPITTIPTDQRPGFAESLLQTFIQSMMAERQNKLDKERLSLVERQVQLQEQDAARSAERQAAQDQAAGSAGQGILALVASQSTSIREMLQNQFPQTVVNPQAIASTAAQASTGRAPSQAAIQQQIRPGGFDARQVPGQAAAVVAPALQQFQQQQAEVKETETRTRAAQQAIDHAELLLPFQQENLQAGTDASRASATESRARTQEIEARRQQLPLERGRERMQLFGQISQVLGDPNRASLVVFGTNMPPTMEQLIAEEGAFITRAGTASAGDPQALASLYDERERTRIAQGVGLQPADQAWLDQQAERVGDPTQLYALAKEAVGEDGSTISEDDLPPIGLYLMARYEGFELPPPDVSLLRRFFRALANPPATPAPAPVASTAEAARNASPRARSRTGGVM